MADSKGHSGRPGAHPLPRRDPQVSGGMGDGRMQRHSCTSCGDVCSFHRHRRARHLSGAACSGPRLVPALVHISHTMLTPGVPLLLPWLCPAFYTAEI